MKLIIDIHDRDYNAVKNGLIPFAILDAIKNGIPLDKIRTKIEQAKLCKVKTNDGREIIANADFVVYPDKRSYTNGLETTLQIIDKYIKEE